MQDQFQHNELRAFSGEAILSMWLNASCIHSAQFHLPNFFLVSPAVYLRASFHNDQIQSLTPLELFYWMKFYVATRPWILFYAPE
jgi:hypothetical protein